MSRIAKKPVIVPAGVDIMMDGRAVSAKGPKGQLRVEVPAAVKVKQQGSELQLVWDDGANAIAGTTRALVQNIVTGVHKGFEKRLSIIGVGYRAAMQGKNLNLTLGFSHPVIYPIPDGITIETPTQTEIVVRGPDKQRVGQVAAEIRAYRPPEPYKGKGVRYTNEHILRKEAKKK